MMILSEMENKSESLGNSGKTNTYFIWKFQLQYLDIKLFLHCSIEALLKKLSIMFRKFTTDIHDCE